MKKIILIILFTSLTNLYSEDQGTNFSLNLTQDPVFGFVPTAKICISETNGFNLLFYGKIWESKQVSDTLGIIQASPEFGFGLAFPLFNDKLKLTPILGLGNGNYHSGGGKSVFLDYLAVSLNADYVYNENMTIKSQFNSRFYVRNIAYIRPKINEFQWQINPEYKFFNNHKIGIYIDQYVLYKKYWTTSATFTQYFWTGISYRVAAAKAALWFSAGVDLVDYFDSGVSSENKELKDYYKLMILFNL